MANVKISQLPAVSSVSGTDVLPVVASTTTSKLTITDLANSLPQVTSSLTASYVLGGAGNAFPFTGSALITGSLGIVGPTQIDSEQLGGLALGITGSIVASNGSLKIQTSTSDVAGGFFVSPGSDYLSFGQQNLSPELYILLSGSNGQLPKPVATRFYSTKGFEFLTDFGQSVEISSSLKVSGSAEFQNGVTGSFSGDGSGLTGITATVAQAVTASGSSIYSTDPATSNFNTTNSIFLGQGTGQNATSATQSVFLGYYAGYNGGSSDAVFIGSNAGYTVSGGSNSVFIGKNTGNSAGNANNSNFIGTYAGVDATGASNSNFIGQEAGIGASSALSSNFLGYKAGSGSINAAGSNFIGSAAGVSATNAASSNFLGTSTGEGAANANYSNFLGETAGYGATDANNSNFLGYNAGYTATNAAYSNFIGRQAGYTADNATYSNFIGYQAGYDSKEATLSNFIGFSAGYNADSASNSNFLGYQAGQSATLASFSNFIGWAAGVNAKSASYSNFIGYKAGASNTPGTNNIVIGTNITLANNQKDSVNIGGIIFATGSYSTPTGAAFSGSMTEAKVGINKVVPDYTLDVSGSGNYAAGLTVSGSGIITTGVSVKRTIDSYGGFEVYDVGNSPVITLSKYNESQQLQIEPSGSSANNKNAVTFITFGTGIAFIPSSGKAVEVTGSFKVTGSFIVPSEVDANPATGSMYVEPAANKLWVYTGNSATGWVTSSLGF